MQELTVVGGGLGGLTAAIAAAEQGMKVRLFEARPALGGRARTTDRPVPGELGSTRHLQRRATVAVARRAWPGEPAARAPLTGKLVFRVDGRGDGASRREAWSVPCFDCDTGPPRSTNRSSTGPRASSDELHARRLADFAGVATFDHDPGRLSAAFVNERLARATVVPPTVRYVPGGWATLDRASGRRGPATSASVIETGARVDDLPDRPVILALPLEAARSLTGDASLMRRAHAPRSSTLRSARPWDGVHRVRPRCAGLGRGVLDTGSVARPSGPSSWSRRRPVSDRTRRSTRL